MLLKLIKNVDKYCAMHRLGTLQKAGCKGLDYCHPAHVLDAFRAIHDAYALLTRKQVANFWIEAGILDPSKVKDVCEGIGISFP